MGIGAPAPVVVPTLVPVEEARPAAPALPTPQAAALAPSVPLASVPEMPTRFVELERFTESELTFLQANSEAVEDCIAELPAAEALRERSRQVQRVNCEIAQR